MKLHVAAGDYADFPNMARILLQSMLKESTKEAVMQLDPEALGEILKKCHGSIDHGCVDTFVRKALLG